MGSYTDTIYPTDDKSSGFSNPKDAWNSSDSSYAYISTLGGSTQTVTYAAKWSPDRIQLYVSPYAVINSVKIVTRIKVSSAGTGDIKTIKWSFNYDGDFDKSASPGLSFNTSFARKEYTLTDSRYNIRDKGALVQMDLDNNRLQTQNICISMFALEIAYTIPEITYTYVDYDGTFITTRTAEQGKTPSHPSNPTRPSTAEYEYTFSGWSLSGTTYTATYTAKKREYTVTLVMNPEEGGWTPGLVSWSYEYGQEINLVVVPNDGYNFVRWNDNAESELISYGGKPAYKRVVTVTGNVTYTAYFEVAKENKQIYVGNKQVSKIYIGDKLVKEVYIGNTKIYG